MMHAKFRKHTQHRNVKHQQLHLSKITTISNYVKHIHNVISCDLTARGHIFDIIFSLF